MDLRSTAGSMMKQYEGFFWVIYFFFPLVLIYFMIYAEQSAISAGFIAAAISHFAGTVYNIGLHKKKIKPDNVAWWVLAFAGVMFTWSHFRLGGFESGGLFVVSTFDMMATAIIATWFHRVKIVRGPIDTILLIAVFITGLICVSNLWQNLVIDTFFWILVINMGVDCLGMVFNLINALRPKHEQIFPWVVTCTACAVNLLAAEWSGYAWMLPLYFFSINMLMLFTVLIGKSFEVKLLFKKHRVEKMLERTIAKL